jgi:hypothetical protein
LCLYNFMPPDIKLVHQKVFVDGVFIAVIMLFSLVMAIIRVADTFRWKKTACTVNRAEILRKNNSSAPGKGCYLSISYSYKINDLSYNSTCYYFHLNPSSVYLNNVQKIVSEYPEGSDAFCYVNPANPEQSVLKRGENPVVILYMSIFTALMLVISFFMWKKFHH